MDRTDGGNHNTAYGVRLSVELITLNKQELKTAAIKACAWWFQWVSDFRHLLTTKDLQPSILCSITLGPFKTDVNTLKLKLNVCTFSSYYYLISTNILCYTAKKKTIIVSMSRYFLTWLYIYFHLGPTGSENTSGFFYIHCLMCFY